MTEPSVILLTLQSCSQCQDSSRQTPSGHAQTLRPQRLGGNKFAVNIHPTRGEEKSSAKKLCGSIIFFCQVINAKPLEIISFHLCHIFLRLGKLPHLPNQLCKTVGDALRCEKILHCSIFIFI